MMWTIVSMMSLETQNRAGGRRAAITLAIRPSTTTARPDSHTNRKTAGRLRSAENRSRQLPLNSATPLITQSPRLGDQRESPPSLETTDPRPGAHSERSRIKFRQRNLADRHLQATLG